MPCFLFAYANDQEAGGQFLRQLSRERKAVRKALDIAGRLGLCQYEFVDDASVEEIIDAFQESQDDVAVFHYGGHAESFQLLLQSRAGDGNERVGGEGLVSFLARQHALQLVCLNGCHTEELADALLDAGVPVVVGTSREINDLTATQWASRFYQGLGAGLSIQRAFDDAVDEIRMSAQGGEVRSLLFRTSKGAAPAQVPWKLKVAPGKEKVLAWSLTQWDPLLGLPLPSVVGGLPEKPFRFFQSYDRQHAAVFFGRAKHIRLLYDKIANPDSPPVILLHGQSGSGKSSLLEAGLLPRLEGEYQVVYVRRDPIKGLAWTLRNAIGEATASPLPSQATQEEAESLEVLLAKLERTLGNHPHSRLLQQQIQSLRLTQGINDLSEENTDVVQSEALNSWLQVEREGKKPLLIVLDQVEEVFTQQQKAEADREWQAFGQVLAELFPPHRSSLKGKLLLGFRKEYLPEIEGGLSEWTIPRTNIFLPTLNGEEIEEIVRGLTSSPSLRERYNLRVEPALPSLIAGELLQKPDATVAPILQILLTQMWEEARRRQPDAPHFSLQLYQEVKQDWSRLEDFIEAQMSRVSTRFPAAVEKGLVGDILYQHTSPGGTSLAREKQALLVWYQHFEDFPSLLGMLIDQLLLKQLGGSVILSHDSLAPVIRKRFQQSDKPGQRARRILDGRMQGQKGGQPQLLDRVDLEAVQVGLLTCESWMAGKKSCGEKHSKRNPPQARNGCPLGKPAGASPCGGRCFVFRL